MCCVLCAVCCVLCAVCLCVCSPLCRSHGLLIYIVSSSSFDFYYSSAQQHFATVLVRPATLCLLIKLLLLCVGLNYLFVWVQGCYCLSNHSHSMYSCPWPSHVVDPAPLAGRSPALSVYASPSWHIHANSRATTQECPSVVPAAH